MNYDLILSSIISAIVVAILTGLFSVALKHFKELKLWRNKEINKIKSVLDGSEDGELFKLITSRQFIPTQGQKEGPHDSEYVIEPSKDRFPLVEKLLNDYIFINKHEGKKRIAILGGAGMGKSTFLISFAYKYITKNKFKKSPFPLYIFYLGDENVISEINNLKNVSTDKDAIILLEALDENIEATRNPNAFLAKLEAATKDFYFVLFTCRTQFFPNEVMEPEYLTVNINSGSKKPIRYNKIYISPFDEEETQEYLSNKFQIGSNEYQKAIRISQNSKDLMCRPMILSFIDDIINVKGSEKFIKAELYYQIVDAWLEREIRNNRYGDITKEQLLSFSKKLALKLYDNWVSNSELSISSKDYGEFLKDNGYKTDPYSLDSMRGRSLLNRKNDGSIKFAHKSFLEFFIAIISLENPGAQFNPTGLEMAKSFAVEMYDKRLSGEEIPFIDFFTSDFILLNSFCDTSCDLQINELYNFYSDKKKVSNNELGKIISNLRIAFLRRLPYRYQCVMETASLTDLSSQKKINDFVDDAKSFFPLSQEIVDELQRCLINLDSFFEQFPSIYRKYAIVNNFLKSYKEDFDITYNDEIIYPYILNLGKIGILKRLKYDIVCLSYGMSTDEDFFSLINKLKHIKAKLNYLVLYRNFESTDEYVKFVLDFQDKVTNKPDVVIIISKYDNKNICYLIDELTSSYSESEINTCINILLSYA